MRLVWAEIDLDAIKHNIGQVKKILNKETKIMSIIKANGYGHGASKVAKESLEDLSDYFGVAVLSEAVELRYKWITKPILILGYTDWQDYDKLIQFDIMQTIFDYGQADKLNEEAAKRDAVVKVHIKVDTGMNRIGFTDTEESVEEIVKIAELPHIQIDGIFSHMANADSLDMDYCGFQLKRFLNFTEKLEDRMLKSKILNKSGFKIPIKHIANSATILEMPEAHLDMVRPGIMLYGQYPSKCVEENAPIELKQALSLKAKIIHLKIVEAGSRISYGGTFITSDKTPIATLPLGYADGLPRLLSNKGQVLVKGQRAPIIGNICMDQLMIDLANVYDFAIGDEVVLFGRQGEDEIRINEVAELANTINYEIMTMLSERVPKLYFKNGQRIE